MKEYVFHWTDGNESRVIADSIESAAKKMGFHRGVLLVLDYYEEITL